MDLPEAKKRIAAVLKELEESTGKVVSNVYLRSVETTTLQDTRQELAVGVEIELMRQPGHNWET
ncbi:MAG: hypothetical protein AAF756_20590 [Pseudomonadota bacterium]